MYAILYSPLCDTKNKIRNIYCSSYCQTSKCSFYLQVKMDIYVAYVYVNIQSPEPFYSCEEFVRPIQSQGKTHCMCK